MCLYQRNTSCCFVTQFIFIEILQLNNVYLARGRIVILTIFQLIFAAPPADQSLDHFHHMEKGR